MKNLNKSTLK